MASIGRLFSSKKQNPLAPGATLYDVCRAATSRRIEGPDEILNQQVRCRGRAATCTAGLP
jgi:hypothetical protein